MFWPIILPFQITFVVMLILVVSFTYVAPMFGRKSVRMLVVTTALAMVVFVPSCVGIELLLDMQRFGIAHYPTHQAIWNFHAPQSIPMSATEIMIDKFESGHCARFKISKIDLESWLDKIWSEHGKSSTIERKLRDARTVTNARDFPDKFRAYDWKPTAETIHYGGPVSARGSGFEIWYSPSDKIAYQRCSYW